MKGISNRNSVIKSAEVAASSRCKIGGASSFAVGIDIGTTTISAAVIDLTQKVVCASFTTPNSSSVKDDNPAFSLQDAKVIAFKVKELADKIISKYDNISVIGLTGQMHGIVYVDKAGKAVSHLTTWQDQRGSLPYGDTGKSYCEELFSISGQMISTGYGFATHFYNLKNQLVPNDAYSFCSIMDYVALYLTERPFPLIHTSVAASFGLFNVQSQSFLGVAQEVIGENLHLPAVTDDFSILGCYRSIPVSIAIGDNQASFLGSVKSPKDSILVNIGTGSQITAMSDFCLTENGSELRPFVKGHYLLCASALCGGASYAILEQFFADYGQALTSQKSSQYALMNQLASVAYKEKTEAPKVDTTFSGTRATPDKKGSITEITTVNFTPKGLILGFLYGMCQELKDLFPWDKCGEKQKLVASGGAVRRIDVMKDIMREVFGLPVSLSSGEEEASVGAALFGTVAQGYFKGIEDFADFIIDA